MRFFNFFRSQPTPQAPHTEEKYQRGEMTYCRYVPAGLSAPTTPSEALVNARRVLEDEGRWARNDWYRIEHPEVDPESPYCDDWKVCAEGAVAMVTIGAHKYTEDLFNERARWNWSNARVFGWGDNAATAEDRELYAVANRFLANAGKEITGYDYSNAHHYNDGHFSTRTEVLAWFDKAIELAQAEERNSVNA